MIVSFKNLFIDIACLDNIKQSKASLMIDTSMPIVLHKRNKLEPDQWNGQLPLVHQ